MSTGKTTYTQVDMNLRTLCRLMYELKKFTLKEFGDKLEERCPKPLELPVFWGVERFLEEYRATGVLSKVKDTYMLQRLRRQYLAHASLA